MPGTYCVLCCALSQKGCGKASRVFSSQWPMALTTPKVYLPNWAIGGLLLGFVAGTYVYTMRAVGTDDLGTELTRELQRQERLAAQQK
jgi:hypothetical protein